MEVANPRPIGVARPRSRAHSIDLIEDEPDDGVFTSDEWDDDAQIGNFTRGVRIICPYGLLRE